MKDKWDILLIDDDKDMVDTLRIILEAEGYAVRSAYDGKSGRAEIERVKPDLIVLDVMMSTDTEGFDLAYKLKINRNFRDIPILMLTSFPKQMAKVGPEKFQHVMGEEWPVTEFMEKPVRPEDLLSVIKAILIEQNQ
jgi:two-component system, OmpR family, alkaline phosphatase synthesis response regulator PhoP